MTSAQHMRALLPVTTALTAEEIGTHIPRALREASVFSARTVYAEHIAGTQADIASVLDGKMSAAQARGLMKLRLRRLGYSPDPREEDTLTDLSSDARTSLIVSQQTQRASGYARWRQDQDPAVLDAFPGQEMFRAARANAPRDWAARWDEARAALGPATTALPAASGFFALKNDPIWTAINRFGTPYPPFDFNSGMRVRAVGRRRCRELGLLADETLAARLLTPARDPMDGSVTSSSAAGMDPALVQAWADAFGGRARVYAGRDGQPRVAVAPPPEAAAQVVDAARDGADATAAFGFPARDALRQIGEALGKPLRPESPLQISAEDVRHILNAHGSETRKGQRPVTLADIRAIPETVNGPGRWRASTEQEKGGFRGDAVTFAADTGERVCFRVTTGKKDPRITVKTMYAEKEKGRPVD